jgi:hypothetical protein
MNIDGQCVIGITSSGSAALTEYVFGTYFLLSFYASFDYDKVSVSLAINAKNTVWTANISKVEPLLPWWAWFLITATIMVVTITGTCLIFRCVAKKKADKELKERLYSVQVVPTDPPARSDSVA